MRILLLALIAWMGNGVATSSVHDFHVSRTLLQYEPEEREWQISMHLFIDDLELALERAGYADLRLGTERESELADSLISIYLTEKLQLQANDELLQYEWLGKEVSNDLTAFWVYLVVPEAMAVEHLQVRHELFFELYDDQQNMLQVAANGRTKSFLLHRDDWQKKIDLK